MLHILTLLLQYIQLSFTYMQSEVPSILFNRCIYPLPLYYLQVAVLQALEKAEQRSKPPMDQLFEDVYKVKPAHLVKQERKLQEHIAKYPAHYGLSHDSSDEGEGDRVEEE